MTQSVRTSTLANPASVTDKHAVLTGDFVRYMDLKLAALGHLTSRHRERLRTTQKADIVLWRRHVAAFAKFQQREERKLNDCPFNIGGRVNYARAQLSRVNSPAYLDELRDTIGADHIFDQIERS